PRPAFARGATPFTLVVEIAGDVSIRAPRSHAGRRCPGAPLPKLRCFNPRPAFARGATHRAAFITSPVQVSIRAPRSHAGRRADARSAQIGRPEVSIRAPRSHAGRLRPCQPAEPQTLITRFSRTSRVFPRAK